MDAKRKLLIGLIVGAVALTATALPGFAAKPTPEKIFRLDITPTTAVGGSSTTFNAKFTNITPGNSSFNSLTLTAPAGFTITALSIAPMPTSSNPNASAITSFSGQTATVTALDPVKSNQFVTVSATTDVPPATDCGGSSGTWTAITWTGSNTAGNTFRMAQSSGLTTTITVACELRFVDGQNPGNASVGAVIPGASGGSVQVELVKGAAPDPDFDGDVTLLQTSGPSATLSGATATATDGVATFSTLKLDTAGTYTLKARAAGVADSDDSPEFTIFDGVINCGGELSFTGEGFGGQRGDFNKDGSSCVLVNYSVTNELAERNQVTVEWDTDAQPNAAFSYTVGWEPETVDPATGTPTERTQLAWQKDGNGDPIWQFGVSCLSSSLPAPYGTLSGAINASATSITVATTASVPNTTFDFVIGTERLRATETDGAWTVVRGVGGTTAAAHDDGVFVMSTPLPIDPNATRPGGGANPFQNKQVPMCIAQEGWAPSGYGQIQVTSTIFDIGDGAMKR